MFAADVLSLSVILPTLNEADEIASTLRSLESAEEILVVDGGSRDETVALALAAAEGVEVIECDRAHRAAQMNRGAGASRGEILLFLHADTRVPAEALERLRETLAGNPDIVGGGFLRRFDSPSPWLRATCRLADVRSRRLGLFLGDQGIFVRRRCFLDLGGFDEEMDLGEDLDFSFRMRRTGSTVAIGPSVLSSARRFERRGVVSQTLRDVLLARRILKYSKGKAEE